MKRTAIKRSPFRRKTRWGYTNKVPALVRAKVFERDRYACQYCGRGANTMDHLLPNADRQRAGIADDDARYIVACCLDCNVRKGTYHYVPQSRAQLIEELNNLCPGGVPYRVWAGGRHQPSTTAEETAPANKLADTAEELASTPLSASVGVETKGVARMR